MSNDEQKNFIDFILEAQKEPKLGMDLMKINTTDELKTFFDKEGYSIKEKECEKIAEAMKNFRNRLIEVNGGRYY